MVNTPTPSDFTKVYELYALVKKDPSVYRIAALFKNILYSFGYGHCEGAELYRLIESNKR